MRQDNLETSMNKQTSIEKGNEWGLDGSWKKFVGIVIFRRNKFVGNVFGGTISWKRLKKYS